MPSRVSLYMAQEEAKVPLVVVGGCLLVAPVVAPLLLLGGLGYFLHLWFCPSVPKVDPYESESGQERRR